MESVKKFDRVRNSLQVIFALYVVTVSLGHTFNWALGESLHSICPFGAIETMHSWITTGKFIHHTGKGNVYIVVGLMFTLIFGGAFFCGWICPFGSIQELFGKFGKKIFKKKYNRIIPIKLDNRLRYFKYIFLLFVLFQTARMFNLVFQNLDPYYTLFNIWTDEIAGTGIIILVAFLGLALISERPYCKYMCPLGAINGIFNSFSIFNIKRASNTCINCSACDRACPMNIEVSKLEKIRDTKCIRCMKCISACPVNQNSATLKFMSFTGKSIKKSYVLAVFMMLFIIPIIVGMNQNAFEEDMSDKKYETVNDIRGSYTIKDIAKSFNIQEKELVHALNIQAENEKKLNILLEEKSLSMDVLRIIIDGLEKPAKEVIGDLPAEYDLELKLRELIKISQAGEIAQAIAQKVKEESESIAIELKRKSMLVDVKKLVKDYDDFLKTFDIAKETPLNTTFRDIIDEKNISMEEIREYVSENQKSNKF